MTTPETALPIPVPSGALWAAIVEGDEPEGDELPRWAVKLGWVASAALAAIVAHTLWRPGCDGVLARPMTVVLLAGGPALVSVLASRGVSPFSSLTGAAAWAFAAGAVATELMRTTGGEALQAPSADGVALLVLAALHVTGLLYIASATLVHGSLAGLIGFLGLWGTAGITHGLVVGASLEEVMGGEGIVEGALGGRILLSPAFIGPNVFLVAVLAVAFFDLFRRLMVGHPRQAAALFAYAALTFATLKVVLDRSDALGLTSLRTVVKALLWVGP